MNIIVLIIIIIQFSILIHVELIPFVLSESFLVTMINLNIDKRKTTYEINYIFNKETFILNNVMGPQCLDIK